MLQKQKRPLAISFQEIRLRVLLIEDDKTILELLKKGLTEAGFNVEGRVNGLEGFELALVEKFDLLILDVMVPGKDGFSVVEDLRKNGNDTPALFLTAKRDVEDRVQGLQRGGDDYLTKPFSFSELLARCQALLRRSIKQSGASKLQYGDLEMDLLARTVRRGKENIELQQKEFTLLEYLLRNQGQVLTKTQILETVWKYDFDPQTNVVDVLVCRLRTKVDRGFQKKFIQTIRGVGYVLRAD
jgi:two-component system OmpR family response regulator